MQLAGVPRLFTRSALGGGMVRLKVIAKLSSPFLVNDFEAIPTQVAAAIGKTPAQVALTWLRRQPGVVIPIIGARRLSQLKDNLACVEFTLDENHLQKLNEVSRIELGFPHDFFGNEVVQNFAFGGMRNLIDNHRTELKVK